VSLDVLPAAYRSVRDVSGRIDQLARWWTQAPQEARFGLIERIYGQKAPQKGDPTLAEFRVAILLAESSSGEVESG
jgi:hypothetical protein